MSKYRSHDSNLLWQVISFKHDVERSSNRCNICDAMREKQMNDSYYFWDLLDLSSLLYNMAKMNEYFINSVDDRKNWKLISNTFEDLRREYILVNQLNLRKIKFIYFCNSISGVYISLLTIILNSHVNFLFYHIWGNSKCSSHNSRAPCTQRFLIFTWAYQLR